MGNLGNVVVIRSVDLTTAQTVTIIISILALVTSVVAVSISIWTNNRDFDRKLRERMDNLLPQMVYANNSHDINQVVFLSLQAVDLLKRKPKLMNSLDYVTTADTLFHAQNWAEANKYWEKAIEKSANDSDFTKIHIRRGYADMLFQQGDYEGGRKWYQEALNVVTSDRDLDKHLNAHTRHMWYVSESYFALGGKSSEEHYQKARGLFERITDRTTRQRGLHILNEARESYLQYERLNEGSAQTPE